MALKENAIARASPPGTQPGRYQACAGRKLGYRF
jgi:hypothetical protein